MEPEKRSIANKYIYCYCSKHAEVLVGIDAYKYLNVFATVGGITFAVLALLSGMSISGKLTLICLLGLPAIALPPLNYLVGKKMMLKAGHSEECSRKIALMIMFRANIWSESKIMENEDTYGKTSPIKKPKERK